MLHFFSVDTCKSRGRGKHEYSGEKKHVFFKVVIYLFGMVVWLQGTVDNVHGCVNSKTIFVSISNVTTWTPAAYRGVWIIYVRIIFLFFGVCLRFKCSQHYRNDSNLTDAINFSCVKKIHSLLWSCCKAALKFLSIRFCIGIKMCAGYSLACRDVQRSCPKPFWQLHGCLN